MNKHVTYCQKVHYTITKKHSHLKNELRCNLYEMHHPYVRHRRIAEKAGADPMGELAKTGKCRSISQGLRE